MRGIAHDTIVEMFDRKTIYIFLVVTAITILIILASGSMEFSFNAEIRGDMDLGDMNEMFGNPIMRMYSSFLTFLVLLAVMATAGLLPGMLVKGRADYFLSKPISRASLLFYKAASMWLVYGAVIVVCGVVCYLLQWLVHGMFEAGFIVLILMNLVSLFIWMSITIFAGIAFGSTGMVIMSAFVVFILQWLLSWHEQIAGFIGSGIVEKIITGLYYIVPKTGEVSDLSLKLAVGGRIESLMPLYSSLAFAVLLYIVTIWLFRRKNY
ncbi:MAG: hypothetical protein KAU36_06555 [candidate division Zixibacteria bacterium]|nr:hypothetical protein [candidate division Zixibacteria bacterium]